MSSAQGKHGGADVRFPPPLVFVGSMAAGLLLERALPLWPGWLQVKPARVIALVLALLAVALLASTLGWFRRTGQRPEPWLPSPELIVRGPYRYSRNPMYLAMVLVQLAVAFAVRALWIVALAPAALAVVHVLAVLPEERYLSERFGEPYRRYLAQVRRYL